MSTFSTELEALNNIYDKLSTLDFYIGVLIGVLLGFIFWNIVKEVK